MLSILKIYSSLNIFMFSNSVLHQVQPPHIAKQAQTELKESSPIKIQTVYTSYIKITSSTYLDLPRARNMPVMAQCPLVSNIWIVLFQLGNLSSAALWHISKTLHQEH